MKYRMKPTEIEAVQFIGSSPDGSAVKTYFDICPPWLEDQLDCGKIMYLEHSMRFSVLTFGVETALYKGDWIILHSRGLIRVCDDETFKMHYEVVK